MNLTLPEKKYGNKASYRWDIAWRSVIVMAAMHAGALYGLYLCLAGHVMWQTLLFSYALKECGMLGITAGAHRLWSHRSYKANLPLRLLLVTFHTLGYSDSIWIWAREHRVHHKWSETDADPHNSRRGYFFSHCGWFMLRKQPEVKEAGSKIDFSDLLADPVVRLHREYYFPLFALIGFALPMAAAVYGWGESVWVAFWVACVLRIVCISHCIWSINSFAHLWPTDLESKAATRLGKKVTSSKPYDARIGPTEYLPVSLVTCGEGWHNFHHTFPNDYRAAEMKFPFNADGGLGQLLGWIINFNPTVPFIDFFAAIGWAWDCKTTSDGMIASYKKQYGEK